MSKSRTQLPSIISIFSAGHSGSTLLALMLGAHSKIFYVGEFHALPRWIIENKTCGCGSYVKKCNFWRSVKNHYKHIYKLDIFSDPRKLPVYETYNVSASHNYVRKIHRGITYLSIIHKFLFPLKWLAQFRWKKIVNTTMSVYDLVNEISGTKIIVDSTKSYLRTYNLFQEYPNLVKVFLLVRDGRAVCHSNITKQGLSMEKAAKRWNNTYIRGTEILYLIPQKSRLLVKYEDICNSPEKEAERMAKFLSIDFEPQMLQISRGLCHSIAGNEMKWKNSDVIKLNEKWKIGLSMKELECFELLAGDINRKFGY